MSEPEKDDLDGLDFVSDLMEGAMQMHELFASYVTAGFTQQQSLYLLGQMINNSKPQA